MSLAFLAKKSWHTANINNQERVWLAEQEKEREKKKTELLRKQMMEEREMEELRRMQGKEGGQERLSWMYAPVSVMQTDADEYLMGKPKEEDKADDDLKKVSLPSLVFFPSFPFTLSHSDFSIHNALHGFSDALHGFCSLRRW